MSREVTISSLASLANEICDAIYPLDSADVDTSLDPELVASELGCEVHELMESICSNVNDYLQLNSGTKELFKGLEAELHTWMVREFLPRVSPGDTAPAPPIVPFLLVCSYAASEMGSDTSLTSSAFYPILSRLLGLDASFNSKVMQSYVAVIDSFWNALRLWLEDATSWNGQRGLVTVFEASSHKHVGKSLSQVLLNSRDKHRLWRLFNSFGLEASMELSVDDIRPLINDWIVESPHASTKRFKSLWATNEYQEKICRIACKELFDSSHRFIDEDDFQDLDLGVRLSARHKPPFGTLILGVAARLNFDKEERELLVRTKAGTTKLHFYPRDDDYMHSAGQLNYQTMSGIRDGFSIAELDGSDKQIFKPKKINILAKDPFTNSYIEVSRPQLATELILVCNLEESEVYELTSLLGEIAAPGWRINPETYSTQNEAIGFVVDELLLKEIPTNIPDHLKNLKPLQRDAVKVQGNVLGLPKSTWFYKFLPSLKIITSDAKEFSLLISNIDTGIDCLARDNLTSPLDVDLNALKLVPGRHVLSLIRNEKTFSSKRFTVISGDSVDRRSWQKAKRLAHDLSNDPKGVISATSALGDLTRVVNGAVATGEFTPRLYANLPKGDLSPWWSKKLEISKNFSSEYEIPSSFGHIDDVIEIMYYFGGGNVSLIKSLLDRLAPENKFAVLDSCRNLSALGIAEFENSMQSSTPQIWEISPACFSQLSNGDFALTGYWPPNRISIIQELLPNNLIRVNTSSDVQREFQPSIALLSGMDIQSLSSFLESNDVGFEIELIEKAGVEILKRLPRLSDVYNSIPRMTIPTYRSASLFSQVVGGFERTTETITKPGGYKILTSTGTKYVHVDEYEFENGLCRYMNPQLLKHSVCARSGRPLLAYSKNMRQLLTPIGAELPGLYERAIALASGSIPRKVVPKGFEGAWKSYEFVDEEMAGYIYSLFSEEW